MIEKKIGVSSHVDEPRRRAKPISIVATLAWTFISRSWLLFSLVGIGVMISVILLCTLPLFTTVATSADLRNMFGATPDGYDFGPQITINKLSPGFLHQAEQITTRTVAQSHVPYISSSQQFSIQTPPLDIFTTPVNTQQVGSSDEQMVLNGYAMQQAQSHVTLLQGQLPQVNSLQQEIQIAVTQSVADNLGLKLGSLLYAHVPSNAGNTVWRVRVVGIFAPMSTTDAFWHQQTFQPQLRGETVLYTVLAENNALIAASNAAQYAAAEPFALSYYYKLNPAAINANDFTTLQMQEQNMSNQFRNLLGSLNNVQQVTPQGTLFTSLSQYGSRIDIAEVSISFLLLQILVLTLIFISIISTLLVEHQSDTIAVLQSRGATQRQILLSFVLQSLFLALIALLIGPVLALQGVRVIAQHLLPTVDQNALDILAQNPLQTVLRESWFAPGAALCAAIIMIISVYRSSGSNILILRREASRIQRPPLWQRLYLDVVLSLLVLVGYIEYSAVQQSFGAETLLLLGPFAFLAPLLMIVAVVLLFLRVFPFLLRTILYVGARWRGITLLALIQLQRSTRIATYFIVILTLTLSFTVFSLIFSASQQQHMLDNAAYQVGADFSGQLPTFAMGQSDKTIAQEYRNIVGVTSVCAGYRTALGPRSGDVMPIQTFAVHTDTFAQTALWIQQNSTQPLSVLMRDLQQYRENGIKQDVVYALVDQSMWAAFHLRQGTPFTLPTSGTTSTNIHFIALDEVSHVPGTYDALPDGYGMIVDYQNFASVYAKDTSTTSLSPNFIWLKTKSDAPDIAHVRAVLTQSSLQLFSLLDRRAEILASHKDALFIAITGTLGVNTLAALFLGMVTTMCVIWTSMVRRQIDFSVKIALGMTRRQLTYLLLWEFSLIYIIALLLGIGLGIALSQIITPLLVFTSSNGNADFFSQLAIPSVQIIIPTQQIIILLSGCIVFLVTLLCLFTLTVSRYTLSQALRLNED